MPDNEQLRLRYLGYPVTKLKVTLFAATLLLKTSLCALLLIVTYTAYIFHHITFCTKKTSHQEYTIQQTHLSIAKSALRLDLSDDLQFLQVNLEPFVGVT